MALPVARCGVVTSFMDMAHRKTNPRAVLAKSRVEVRRSSRHKQFIGQDAGEAAGRAAELGRVEQLQHAQSERELQRLHATPLGQLLRDLLVHTGSLLGALALAPFRVARAFLPGAARA